MRLTAESRQVIRATARDIFGPQAEVRLFGSRLDDSARGGDIDLLILSDEAIADRERKALRLVARLQVRLGDQPIDVLVIDPASDRRPIHAHALRQGATI